MNTFTQPAYKSAAFWTFVVAVIAQLAIGLGYGKEAEMLGTIAASLIAYLTANGIIQKEAIKAQVALRQMASDEKTAAIYANETENRRIIAELREKK